MYWVLVWQRIPKAQIGVEYKQKKIIKKENKNEENNKKVNENQSHRHSIHILVET